MSIHEEWYLNRGWKFLEGEIQSGKKMDHATAYRHTKTRCDDGVFAANFDDTEWQTVNLPHDFVLAHLPEEAYSISDGCRRRGTAWYRRQFRLENEDREKDIELVVDGISTYAEIYFNGSLVYESRSGYAPFHVDLTPFCNYEGFLNTLAVHVIAEDREGWWYEGAGMYRDVKLIKRGRLHFITGGLFINPVYDEAEKLWHIPVMAEIGNSGEKETPVRVRFTLTDPEGKTVVTAETGSFAADVLTCTKTACDLKVGQKVRLWDVDDPVLYRVTAQLFTEGGTLTDEVVTRCGFRTIRFDAEKGFWLNGRNLKLKGTCNHQDHACVGVAVPRSVEKFRLLKLKEMGCNAYRCSHNPPSQTLLDLCDELGMLVMDENRHYSTAEVYLRHLEDLVRRDRNHPSVILWSLFNEEPLQGTEMGRELARRMVLLVRRLDPTRFTTAAMNGGYLQEANASQVLDVTGINYFIHDYDAYHELAPEHPVLSSEDTSAVTSRGELVTNAEKHTLCDDDTEAVSWGATQRKAWKAIDTRPWMAGGFLWTGFDYRGEPTPYQFPSNVSFFGTMDLCGFPKAGFYIRQAMWRKDIPVLEIAPHWNRKEAPGTFVKVLVISNAAKVELFLNGKSYGRQTADPYDMNLFELPYEPGELRAVSYDAEDNVVKTTILSTVGKAVKLCLEPDRTKIENDDYDTVPLTVYAVDAEGRRVPDAGSLVHFTLTGPGEIAGVGNGDENDCSSDVLPERHLFNGYAQIMLRTAVDAPEGAALTLKAESEGLESAECTLDIVAASGDRKYMPQAERVCGCRVWRHSSLTEAEPDPQIKVAANDMNTWEVVETGMRLSAKDGLYTLYRPDEAFPLKPGNVMQFERIDGLAEFFLDGRRIAYKWMDDSRGIIFQIPEDVTGKEQFTIRMRACADNCIGLIGPVFLTEA